MRAVVIALFVVLATASLLHSPDPESVIDAAANLAPLDGEYVVLQQRESALRALPPTLNVRAAHMGATMHVMTVHGQSESALRAMFPDAVISPNRKIAHNAIWNLDRLDERLLSAIDGTWTGPSNGGAGVTVYIVDSGVDTLHLDFGSRASTLFSAFGTNIYDDCGHGTHVAGTAGGNSHGVARGVALRSVKVLAGSGCSGSISDLAAGLLYVRDAAVSQRAVINLSLGFSGSDSVIGTLIANIIADGNVVVAAAGNDASTACGHYPASYSGVLSVGATNEVDAMASFSNYGSCVDIFAPGVDIVSARAGTTGYIIMDGTSMSTPHVVGVIALLWQQNPGSSGVQIAQQVLTAATRGALTGLRGSPDLLAFWSADGDGSQAPAPSSPPAILAPPQPASPSSALAASLGFVVGLVAALQ